MIHKELSLTTNNIVCSRCIMDTTVPDIIFDKDGVCQFCTQLEERIGSEVHDDVQGQINLENMINKIRKRGIGREYDCLIGVSGGVDSSYLAYLIKTKYNLRPLAIHLDNGWNSELAVANVEQLLNRLKIDLITTVLDWEEFKDLQISFLKSSISNIEIPTDHAIWALLIRTAVKFKIPYIISGSNIVTEALMPESWLYGSKDAKLITGIHNKYGKVKLQTYPKLSTFDFAYYLIGKGIKWIPILNYIPYVKSEAKKILTDELGWRDYGGKHYESIYTRFFHAYYLPKKFGYDLRRSYLSALVVSGQINRDDALEEIQTPTMPADKLEEDRCYVQKKLRLSDDEFAQIMSASPKTFADYPNNDSLWRRYSYLVQYFRDKIIRVG